MRSRTEPASPERRDGLALDVTGRAASGALRGRQLDEVRHLDTCWFLWTAFQPDTRLLD